MASLGICSKPTVDSVDSIKVFFGYRVSGVEGEEIGVMGDSYTSCALRNVLIRAAHKRC